MASARIGMIDVRGIAECTARVFLNDPDRHHGETYTLTGPRSLTFDEVADQASLALGRSITYLPVSDDSGWGDFTTDTVSDLLGHPPRDIADFVRDHAAAFTSADDN